MRRSDGTESPAGMYAVERGSHSTERNDGWRARLENARQQPLGCILCTERIWQGFLDLRI